MKSKPSSHSINFNCEKDEQDMLYDFDERITPPANFELEQYQKTTIDDIQRYTPTTVHFSTEGFEVVDKLKVFVENYVMGYLMKSVEKNLKCDCCKEFYTAKEISKFYT